MDPLTVSVYGEMVQPQLTDSGKLPRVCVCVCDWVRTDCFLTILVQEELVESQTAGLFADEAVHVLCAVVVNSNGIFQRLNTRLQTERDLGVSNCVPEEQTDVCLNVCHCKRLHFWWAPNLKKLCLYQVS